MTSNGEYLFIKGHNQYGVLISIVTSNGEYVFIKGHKQYGVVNSDGEVKIIKGQQQDRVTIIAASTPRLPSATRWTPSSPATSQSAT